MDAENEADSIFFGIVRGLRRNSIYKPVIEVVTSVSLNQNSKVKVRKSGLPSFQEVLIFKKFVTLLECIYNSHYGNGVPSICTS